MKSYLFSIFVRSFLAFSGFLVFILTAYLYGAEGRGIIGYGVSLFAIFGSVLSFNLGRGFLAETFGNEQQKYDMLGSFLTLNFILGVMAALGGLFYWYFSTTGREMLTLRQVIFFAATSAFAIWTSNGNFFFSSFFKTTLQELVILSTRMVLILFLVTLILLKSRYIDLFIGGYSAILFIGVLAENILLLKISKRKILKKLELKVFWRIIKKSIIHHIDYLAFSIFPLVLTVFSASYVSKADVGQVNFAMQGINIVFLLSVTANIRLMAYASDSGFRAKISQYKKLFIFTLGASVLAVFSLYFALKISLQLFKAYQFGDVASLFLLSSLAVPGFLLYQFLNPIWIELRLEKILMFWNLANFLICLGFTPMVLRNYKLTGVMLIYALFYIGILLIQMGMFLKKFSLKSERVI